MAFVPFHQIHQSLLECRFNHIKRFAMAFRLMFFIVCLSSLTERLCGQSTIYLDKTDDCFQEFVWENASSGESSWSLHIPIGKEARVVLDIDPRAETVFRKPENIKPCSLLQPNTGLVSDLNTGRRVIFIVEQFRPGSYRVYRVDRAAYVLVTGNYIKYSDADLNFAYDADIGSKRSDLSASRTGYKVFLDEVLSEECPRSWRFQYDGGRNGAADRQFVITEGAGITQGGFGHPVASSLLSADGVTLPEYLDRFCSGVGKVQAIREETSAPPAQPATWQEAGLERVYLDEQSGLYIDRSTWRPADGEIDGLTYNSGKLGDPSTSPADLPVPAAESAPTPVGKPLVWTPPNAADRRDETAPLDFSQFHVVKKGESFFSIAETYQIEPDELRAMNGMRDWEILYPGQRIKIASRSAESGPSKSTASGPGRVTVIPALSADLTSPTAPPVQENPVREAPTTSVPQVPAQEETLISPVQPSPAGQSYYVVTKGDTLWSIARQHGLSVEELKRFNNLTSDAIQIGQRLRVK